VGANAFMLSFMQIECVGAKTAARSGVSRQLQSLATSDDGSDLGVSSDHGGRRNSVGVFLSRANEAC
jgi:hypothetical protein